MAPMRSRRQLVVRSARRVSSSDPALETSRTSRPASRLSSGVTARSSHTCVATRSRFLPPRISQAYKAWRARARARDSIRIVRLEPAEQIDHLERGNGGVEALVAVRPAGACLGLLVGVAGEHAETNRSLRFCARRGETAGCFAGYVIEVCSVASDHRAEGDDPIIALARQEPAGGER